MNTIEITVKDIHGFARTIEVEPINNGSSVVVEIDRDDWIGKETAIEVLGGLETIGDNYAGHSADEIATLVNKEVNDNFFDDLPDFGDMTIVFISEFTQFEADDFEGIVTI